MVQDVFEKNPLAHTLSKQSLSQLKPILEVGEEMYFKSSLRFIFQLDWALTTIQNITKGKEKGFDRAQLKAVIRFKKKKNDVSCLYLTE